MRVSQAKPTRTIQCVSITCGISPFSDRMHPIMSHPPNQIYMNSRWFELILTTIVRSTRSELDLNADYSPSLPFYYGITFPASLYINCATTRSHRLLPQANPHSLHAASPSLPARFRSHRRG